MTEMKEVRTSGRFAQGDLGMQIGPAFPRAPRYLVKHIKECIMRNRKLSLAFAGGLLVLALAGCPSPGGSGDPSLGGSGGPPGAPVLSSVSPGDSKATVTWGSSSGATSYNIYYLQGSTVSTASGTKVTAVSSPYELTALTNGTKCAVLVTAVNGAGESDASSVLSTAVGLPPRIVFTRYTSTGVTIANWLTSPGATSYNLYRKAGSTVTPATGEKIWSITAPFTMTDLSGGTQYAFSMTAVYPAGEGPAGPVVTVTPSATPAIGLQGMARLDLKLGAAMAVGTTLNPVNVTFLKLENAGSGTLSGLSTSVSYPSGGTGWVSAPNLSGSSIPSASSTSFPLYLDTSKLHAGTNTAVVTVSGTGVASVGYTINAVLDTTTVVVGSFAVSPWIDPGATFDLGTLPAGSSTAIVVFAFTNILGSPVTIGPSPLPPGFQSYSGGLIGNTTYLSFSFQPATVGAVGPYAFSVPWTGGTGSPYSIYLKAAGN